MLDSNFPHADIRSIRGEKFFRGLNRVIPLGRKYHPLIRILNGRSGLLAIPFNQYQVLRPAVWTKSVASQLLSGSESIVEFELLRPVCASLPKGLIVDTGANVGLYTLEFRSACGNPILAYEPQPFLFKLLQWNIQLNELRDVEARNIACGSERGDATFSLGLNGSLVTESAKGAVPKPVISDTKSPWEEQEFLTRSGAIITVPVTTLDDDLAGHSSIALLKIDCEGFEYHIIQGARELLKRHRPILFIEVHPEQIRQFGHSTEALLELLAPDYEFEFWYFRVGRHGSKLARSLAKFRRPQGVRFADAAEMLRAAGSTPGPAQIYWLGRPQPNKGPR